MWDLVPWPGITPRPPALDAWTLCHWSIRGVPLCTALPVHWRLTSHKVENFSRTRTWWGPCCNFSAQLSARLWTAFDNHWADKPLSSVSDFVVAAVSLKDLSHSLQLHGLQHARLLCPPLSPGVCSNSCPLSQGCYLTISSLAIPFSFWLQSFPASGSFALYKIISFFPF